MSTRIALRSAVLLATAAAAFSAFAVTPTVDAAYVANAEERCAPLPAGYRQACLDRVHGRGESVGSVQGGGIITTSTTTAPLGTMKTAPAAAPAPATQVRTESEVHRTRKHQRRAVRKHVKQHKAAVAAVTKASGASAATTTTTTTTTVVTPAKPTLSQKAVKSAKTAASAVKNAASK